MVGIASRKYSGISGYTRKELEGKDFTQSFANPDNVKDFLSSDKKVMKATLVCKDYIKRFKKVVGPEQKNQKPEHKTVKLTLTKKSIYLRDDKEPSDQNPIMAYQVLMTRAKSSGVPMRVRVRAVRMGVRKLAESLGKKKRNEDNAKKIRESTTMEEIEDELTP